MRVVRRAARAGIAALATAGLLVACGAATELPTRERASGCALPTLHGVVVTTFHGDRARLGFSPNETALTPASVSGGGFGALWSSAPFDATVLGGVVYPGRLYASPLYVDDLDVLGGDLDGQRLDVVIAATSNGWVYAVNAVATTCRVGAAPAGRVAWKTKLGDASVVPFLDAGGGFPGIALGVLGTPVIDLQASPPRLYVVSMDATPGGAPTWKAYALDLRSGTLLDGWPVSLDAAAIEPVDRNGPTAFDRDATQSSQRGALNLSPDGVTLYVPLGGYTDHAAGWLVAIDTRASRVVASFSGARGATLGIANAGMWGAGGVAIDAAGDVYVTTGNGPLDWAARGAPAAWGNSFLRWSPDLTLRASYSPWNFCQDEIGDTDVGGGSPILLDLDPSTTATPHLAAFGSKQGTVYLVDRDHLPGSNQGRPACSSSAAWDQAARDGSLLGPAGAPYCNPQAAGQCAQGPLSVFGPYSDDAMANQVDHAKLRSTPALFRDAAGAAYLFVSGSTKADAGSIENVPPSLARLRVHLAPGERAYLAVDAVDRELSFVNPGSPVVTSNGPNDAVVWVVDQNARRTQPLLDPSTRHPVLYAVDAASMKLLWKSGEGDLEVGGKYVTPAIAHGTVFVGTDRIRAFGMRTH